MVANFVVEVEKVGRKLEDTVAALEEAAVLEAVTAFEVTTLPVGMEFLIEKAQIDESTC